MSQSKNKLLVTCASGDIGKMVLEELKRKGSSKNVIATSKNISDLKEFEKSGFEVREADFSSKQSLIPAFKGAKKILFIGSNESEKRVEKHQNVIKAARELGMKHIVYISFPNLDKSKSELARDHLETEKMIMESGINYTILRASVFAEHLIPTLKKSLESGEFISTAGESRVAFITKHDIAVAACYALLKDDESNSVLELSGTQAYNYEEVIKIASELKNKPISFKNVTSEEYKRYLDTTDFDEQSKKLYASFDEDLKNGEFGDVSNDFNKFVGRKPQTLKDFLAKELKV